MRLRAATTFWVGIMAMAASGGCGDRNTEVINIDGHRFDVPREHLIEERIPWLPESPEKGLMFIINPAAPLPEQMSVLIESTSITCNPKTPPAYGQLTSVCGAARRRADHVHQAQSLPLVKELWNGDHTQWIYRLTDKRGKSQGDIVATCSAMGDGNGLCHSLSNYGDLVYTISLRDSDIARLPEIRKEVVELLSSWEKVAH